MSKYKAHVIFSGISLFPLAGFAIDMGAPWLGIGIAIAGLVTLGIGTGGMR